VQFQQICVFFKYCKINNDKRHYDSNKAAAWSGTKPETSAKTALACSVRKTMCRHFPTKSTNILHETTNASNWTINQCKNDTGKLTQTDYFTVPMKTKEQLAIKKNNRSRFTTQ